jgi:hypothetical protein
VGLFSVRTFKKKKKSGHGAQLVSTMIEAEGKAIIFHCWAYSR